MASVDIAWPFGLGQLVDLYSSQLILILNFGKLDQPRQI